MGCRGRGRIWADQDAAYLQSLESERIAETSVDVEYYSLNRGTNVDPVYGEPTNDPVWGGSSPSQRGEPQQHKLSWSFCPNVADGDPSLVIVGSVEYTESDDRNPIVRPEGKSVEYDAILVISAVHWECALEEHTSECIKGRTPKEGDVLYTMLEWWDIKKVGKSGNILGTATTVGYRFELKKRSEFSPDRKINQG